MILVLILLYFLLMLKKLNCAFLMNMVRKSSCALFYPYVNMMFGMVFFEDLKQV